MSYEYQVEKERMDESIGKVGGMVCGALACATSLTIGSAAMSEADLEQLDGITAGTAAA